MKPCTGVAVESVTSRPPLPVISLRSSMPPFMDHERLGDRDAAVGELDQRDGVVLAGGLVGVAERGAPGERLGQRDVLAEEVARRLDRVAAHVEQRAAAGRLGVPEVRGVRAGVRLAGADGEHLADRAVLDHLARLHHVRREHLGLGVAVHHAGVLDDPEDLRRLRRVAGERLRADDRLAGARRRPGSRPRACGSGARRRRSRPRRRRHSASTSVYWRGMSWRSPNSSARSALR